MDRTARAPLGKGRFRAIYRLTGPGDRARRTAEDICIEQTVEFPEDLIRRAAIHDRIVGQVAWIEPRGTRRFEAAIDYPVAVAGGEITQLLNVLFGNISLKPGICLVDCDLPADLLSAFRGPRFGRAGLRDLLQVEGRPLVCSAIKPMGLSNRELADLAYELALGGCDLIKDDHGLADQRFSRFEDRVRRVGAKVARARQKTGRPCLYLANVTAPADAIRDRAACAKEAGAGGYLIAPGLVGFDAMRRLADDDRLGLPILAHPALLGAYTVRGADGISHRVIYGFLNRLAGADGAIFPNFKGRFSFTPQACRELVEGTARPMGRIAPIFPVPAGGMALDRVRGLVDFYGKEAILLIGGDLHRHGSGPRDGCRRFLDQVLEAAARVPGND